MTNALILIPARYGSSRFPGKPLAKIKNKPMIEYVIENCKESGFDYAVVTDDQRIEDFIQSINGNVVRIDDDVPSGSERICLAYERFYSDKNYDLIINVQGDEPLLKAQTIQNIAKAHMQTDFDIFTGLNERSSNDSDFKNPNIVKCIYNAENKKCLYFSRESIPFSRDEKNHSWFHHIGIYSYRPSALISFNKLEMSYHEKLEKLEQLRALDNNLNIGAQVINVQLIGVDTPEDIEKVEGVFK